MLDDLLREQRSVGQVQSEGEFTVSLEDARRKLAHFQTDEPLFVLLKLIQASVSAGATSIRIRTRPGGFRLDAPQAWLELEPLRCRMVQARFEASDSPVGLLATALLGFSGRFKATIGGQTLEGETFRRVEPTEGLVVECWGSFPTEGLAERVCHAPLPIRLDDRILNHCLTGGGEHVLPGEGVSWVGRWEPGRVAGCRTFPLPFPGDEQSFTDGVVPVGRAILRYHGGDGGTVTLVKHGVTLRNTPSLGMEGCHAVVAANDLPVDLSTLRALEGEELRGRLVQVTDDVRTWYRERVAQLGAPRPSSPGLWLSLRRLNWTAWLPILLLVLCLPMLLPILVPLCVWAWLTTPRRQGPGTLERLKAFLNEEGISADADLELDPSPARPADGPH